MRPVALAARQDFPSTPLTVVCRFDCRHTAFSEHWRIAVRQAAQDPSANHGVWAVSSRKRDCRHDSVGGASHRVSDYAAKESIGCADLTNESDYGTESPVPRWFSRSRAHGRRRSRRARRPSPAPGTASQLCPGTNASSLEAMGGAGMVRGCVPAAWESCHRGLGWLSCSPARELFL